MTEFAYDKPKTRARLAIMHYICEFSLAREFSNGQPFAGSSDYRFTFADMCRPGDLVALQSAPASKWYLSWAHTIDVQQYGNVYTLESIEDGELCNWSNVSVLIFNRKTASEYPSWRWTDKQFEFRDRWKTVCFKERDAYITLPIDPQFGDNYEVTLGTRTRHSFDDRRPTKTYPDWRKVTKAMMLDFYDECIAAREGATASA
jgi:hypothetical protein